MKNPDLPPPYAALTPDLLLDAVDSIGYHCDGRLQTLNSYENRVYQIGLADDSVLIAKFYRPARWSDEAILEEHAFTLDLADREIPVVPPLRNSQGVTLHEHGGFRFALFEKCGGRMPELDDRDTLQWMGRFLARIHAVGTLAPFHARPAIDIASFGTEPFSFLVDNGFIPADLEIAYCTLVEDVLRRVTAKFADTGSVAQLRLHGDCHPGNILWRANGPHFVDLDDCRTGPAIQDIWMLLSGERAAMSEQLRHIIRGYREFYDFNPRELQLLEALRTLRMIHYSGWLARRWSDPAFPASFPWFNTQHYWQDQILALREQAALLDEPALVLE